MSASFDVTYKLISWRSSTMNFSLNVKKRMRKNLSSVYCGQLSLLENFTTLGFLSQPRQSKEQIGTKSTKVCKACKARLPIEDFPYFSTSKAGRKNTCKSCTKKLSEIRKQLKEQNPPPPPGPCPICHEHTENWVLDHCHTSNEFRGYICDHCNLGLGKFRDDPEILKSAIDYLSTTAYATQSKI